ncbi:phage tail domain-containing protein [Oceanobacillus jeddahense]|uniref:phage tail domain-containing protein n=1 Tax=Oceanobacillus jeddahense TaxID=1462527 RepID=UPI000596043B|nr:phage tail domain-containing protein [Oceanobacillus jeddahense]
MDAQIIRKNGDAFNFEDFGVIVKDFIVSSIEINPQYENPEGSDKQIDYGSAYGKRTIRIPFVARGKDYHDYPLLRDLLFEKVLDKESYYIRERRRAKKLAYAFVDPNEPAKMDESTNNQFVGGKRYLVRLQNTFELEQMIYDGEGELVYETTELPFAESIGTTADINRDGINYNSEIWGYGMGLTLEYMQPDQFDQSITYNIEAKVDNPFWIYNAGNVGVHPFEQDLKITFRDIINSDGRVQLRNQTNQDYIRINDDNLSRSDVYIFDGPNVTKNGLNAFHDTGRTFISMNPGWNRFQLYYCDSATIEYDFRYYYK